MLDFKNSSFTYDKNIPALKDITLHFDEGESVALIGPNGSGKSTFLKLLSGLITPDRGSFCFEGEEITSKKMQDNIFSKAFHKKVGFVFQNSDAQLFCPDVYDEIAFGPRQMGMNEAEVKRRVNDTIKLLKIEDLVGRQPYHLSGGEKKKVAMASVIVLNPEVLILDEPMNGLDPKAKRFLRDFLIALNKSGKTILCSTHDFSYVEGVFKRAVVFSNDHTIIRDGNYDEIMKDIDFLKENNII